MPSSNEAKRVRPPTAFAATWSTETPSLMSAPGSLAGMDSGEERSRGPRVVAGAVAERPSGVVRQAGKNQQVLPVGFERLQDRRELERGACGLAGVQASWMTPLGI